MFTFWFKDHLCRRGCFNLRGYWYTATCKPDAPVVITNNLTSVPRTVKGEGENLMPQSCPLTFTLACMHAYTHTHTHKP